MAARSRRTACLQASHDHIDDFADETIRQRQVPQQQAMLGRAEQQVQDDFTVGPGRNLAPCDRPVKHDPVLLAERLQDALAVARGQFLIVLGFADEIAQYPSGRGPRDRRDPRPQFRSQIAAERAGIGQWLLLLELHQERVEREGTL